MPIQISSEAKNISANKKELTIKSSCTSSKIESPSFSHITNAENDSDTDNRKNSENKIRKNFFPQKLMRIITSTMFEDCTTWDREGKSFAVTDFEKFAIRSNLIGSAFMKESFVRKLNRWGFRLHEIEGCGYYSHPLFLRDKPWLCKRMRCKKSTSALSESRAEKTSDMPNKRNIDESTDMILPKSNHILKRKISDLEDNIAEVEHKCDHSGHQSLFEDFFGYFEKNCGVTS